MPRMNFRILSFNVLAQNWIDVHLRRVVDAAFLRRDYRIAKHIEVFRNAKPEIMLLQEVTPIVLSKYQQALPDYEAYFTPLHWKPTRPRDPVNGNAILWRRDVLHCIARTQIDLVRRKGNYGQMVSGVLKKTQQTLRLVNVHFEWGDVESASDEFHHIFAGGFVGSHKRVVIAGDFNMGGAIDTFPIIDDIQKYQFVDAAPQLRTHPFADEDQTVTHVLCRGLQIRSAAIVGQGTSSVNECLKRYGSDHFPVLANLSI